MFNLALALAFAIFFQFAPGGMILQLLVDGPVLQSLPPYQAHLLLSVVNHWIPAALVYFLFRLPRLGGFIRPRVAIHVLLGLANVLLVLYVAVRVFASTIQGGGASFVVMSFAPLVIYPAKVLLAIGLIWLLIRSVDKRKEPPESNSRPPSIADGIVFVLVFGVPVSIGASVLFLTENAPFRLAKQAKLVFDERCKTAGEKIMDSPQGVQSVYLDRDGGAYFDNIVNGVYAGHGGGILGEPLVNSGLLLYFEKKNDRQRMDGSTAKYRRYVFRDWKGEPVEELTSDYGVFQMNLTTEDEQKRLRISGTEVTIKHVKTGQIIATLTYFTSDRHRAICGHSNKEHFSVSEFVRRALNLTQRFPSAYSDNTGKNQ